MGSGLPLENNKAIGFLIDTGLDLVEKSQSYQDSFLCLATIGPPAKRHLNGVSLVGR